MATPSRPATEFSLSTALIVLDGLGDRPHPATEQKSPVEAAATPNLDRLAVRGMLGNVTVVGPGVAPESDAGVFALLGYDPVHDSPGRGVLEALGVEVPLEVGDVALRLNFATVDGDGTVLDSRVGRSLGTNEAANSLGVSRRRICLPPRRFARRCARPWDIAASSGYIPSEAAPSRPKFRTPTRSMRRSAAWVRPDGPKLRRSSR
jgi:hypothetical protein